LIESESIYVNGELDGKKNYYYENTAIRQSENYYKGKLDSWLKLYYPNGKLKSEEYYREGEMIRKKEYNSNGDLVSTFGY
jgi:antitoxin component YwqK of YwqJK toxin-antitoxin module